MPATRDGKLWRSQFYYKDWQGIRRKKNNPKAEEIKADNAARQEWNRTVDVALVEGVPEEDILKIKQEKITDKTLQSIRTHGWLRICSVRLSEVRKTFYRK